MLNSVYTKSCHPDTPPTSTVDGRFHVHSHDTHMHTKTYNERALWYNTEGRLSAFAHDESASGGLW